MVPDYKVQGCMVPLELQAQEAQEAHGALGHHGAHGVQVVPKDLLGPAKKQNDLQKSEKQQWPNNSKVNSWVMPGLWAQYRREY